MVLDTDCLILAVPPDHRLAYKSMMMGLSIENLSMMRETNIVYSDDFEYTDFLQDLVKRYNEMRR